MSTALKHILLKLGTDDKSRKEFFNGGREALLSQYDLTVEEKQCLKELTEEKLPQLVASSTNNVVANDIRI